MMKKNNDGKKPTRMPLTNRRKCWQIERAKRADRKEKIVRAGAIQCKK